MSNWSQYHVELKRSSASKSSLLREGWYIGDGWVKVFKGSLYSNNVVQMKPYLQKELHVVRRRYKA
jgi:hypothetical protein